MPVKPLSIQGNITILTVSDVFFDELDIPQPDYHLGVGSGTHGQNTGRTLESIESVLLNSKPDWVLGFMVILIQP